MAGDSRASFVSFLNAYPRIAIRLPDTVLNIESTGGLQTVPSDTHSSGLPAPSTGNLRKVKVPAKVTKIEYIFLEAGTAKTDRTF